MAWELSNLIAINRSSERSVSGHDGTTDSNARPDTFRALDRVEALTPGQARECRGATTEQDIRWMCPASDPEPVVTRFQDQPMDFDGTRRRKTV